jgi:glycolate oxidase FAD binding subunit
VSALADGALEALRRAAGEVAVEPVEIDGAKLAATLRPRDADAVSRTVAALAERAIGCVIVGGGSRVEFGNPPRGARVVLSTARLDGVAELDADEGVARILAGTPLASARAAVQAAGWELPFDPPGARSTLGGVLASGAVGPRHLGWGRPRDAVLGLDVVLGDGAATRCGGRVVKNVTGYDLMKLHVGACGALGVITAAWLRLRPRPEIERLLAAPLDGSPEAFDRALAAARAPTARACVLADARIAAAIDPQRAPIAGWLLLVECAGDEAAVARDAERLASALGAEAAEPTALARARSLQGETFGTAGLRFRLAVLPSRLAAVVAELHRGDAAVLAHPGTGLVYARSVLDAETDGASLDRAWQTARRAAQLGAGHALLEAAPAWAKPLHDVFGDPSDEWRLARALKARFDPSAVLNPGRFAGGI